MANKIIQLNRPLTQEELSSQNKPKNNVIQLNRPLTTEEISSNNQPEPSVGFFGKVPLSKYQSGERNIMGNIMDRPAAAIRSAIQGKGYVQGAVNPGNVPTFQEQLLDTYYKKTPDFPGKTALGNLPSGVGLAADVVTNPANLLTGLAPKLPIGAGKTLGKVAMQTKPMQALKTVGNKPIQDLKISKTLSSERAGGFPMGSNKNIDTVIDTAINKAIRPSVAGKSTSSQTSGYSNRARQAVQTIYDNKNNLQFLDEAGQPTNRLPETLKDFSSSIEQTKASLWNKIDSLTKQTGKSGVSIDTKDIIGELEKIPSNRLIKILHRDTSDYAEKQIEAFRQLGNLTPEEAQAEIKTLNDSLSAYYRNPTFDTARKAQVDALIANNLRKALDESINRVTGEQYQILKNQYGALKTIEKDVNRRAIVDARKNIKGLIDFSDILSGSDMASGILHLDPRLFATGIVKKSIASYIKSINDPNNIVKNMFKTVDKFYKKP